MVKGIGGVAIYARDPAALAEWYATHLGLSSVDEPGGARSWDFYFRDSEDPELRRRTVWTILPAPESLPPEGRIPVVNYLVENLEELVARLRAAGVEVQTVEEHADGRFARLRDPEGHRIELWED